MTLASAYDERFFSEEVFARMFHASPVALSLSALAEGRYLEVNDSFLRATGYARAEVIGRRSVELGLWAVDGDRDRIVEALLAAGWLIGTRGFTSANTVPIHLFGAPLIGFAVLNWFGRTANEGETLRAIVLANLISATLGFLAALLQQLSGEVNALGWSSVVIYLLLAPGFAYFQFMKPSVMRPSGA